MEKDKKVVFRLEDEDKEALSNTLNILKDISCEMERADSYKDVTIVNTDLNKHIELFDAFDEIYDYVRSICDYLSHCSN